VGSVVADPECLRRREEGDTGDEDRSDDIFFLQQKDGDEDAMEKKWESEKRHWLVKIWYLFSHDQSN
jgi:hypothetical protein